MADLSARTRETVNLIALQGTDAAFVESVESQTPLRVTSRLGAVMPAHCVSGGKVLLAQLSREDLEKLYPDEDLVQLTSKSISNRNTLFKELARIRSRGHQRGGERIQRLRPGDGRGRARTTRVIGARHRGPLFAASSQEVDRTTPAASHNCVHPARQRPVAPT